MFLKAALVLGLVFFLPVALVCRQIERQYKAARSRTSVSGRPHRLVRKMYVFVKLSGLSDFSDFLLSDNCSGKMHRTRPQQARAVPLLAAA